MHRDSMNKTKYCKIVSNNITLSSWLLPGIKVGECPQCKKSNAPLV